MLPSFTPWLLLTAVLGALFGWSIQAQNLAAVMGVFPLFAAAIIALLDNVTSGPSD